MAWKKERNISSVIDFMGDHMLVHNIHNSTKVYLTKRSFHKNTGFNGAILIYREHMNLAKLRYSQLTNLGGPYFKF